MVKAGHAWEDAGVSMRKMSPRDPNPLGSEGAVLSMTLRSAVADVECGLAGCARKIADGKYDSSTISGSPALPGAGSRRSLKPCRVVLCLLNVWAQQGEAETRSKTLSSTQHTLAPEPQCGWRSAGSARADVSLGEAGGRGGGRGAKALVDGLGVAGGHRYMPPEQMEGGRLTLKVDVWAMG
eukprot:970194-Rhodomonas_salina.1